MTPLERPTVRRLSRCLLRWVAAGGLVLSLAGCGLGLVYPRLDRVVGFYLEGLVTLDQTQSAALERTLARNLEWHRGSELQRYAAFLRETAAALEGGAGRDAWLEASRRTEDYWRDIFEQAAPGYTALAATFTDAQVAELIENLERTDDKAWRKFARQEPRERDARREKSMLRALERFTGPLEPAQRALVRRHVASSPSFMAEWHDNRRAWRAELADALARRGAGAEFEARMFVLIARPDELWTPGYRTALEQRRAALVDLLVSLESTLTPQQRAAARREFLALADEVQGLARRRG